MLRGSHFAAAAAILFLWGRILSAAEVDSTALWLTMTIPVSFWLLIDWLARGSGDWVGENPPPEGSERFFCYLFIGAGMLPLLAKATGVMELRRFVPDWLAFLDLGGLAVVVVGISLIVTPIVRLLRWSDALFGRTHHGAGGGGGP